MTQPLFMYRQKFKQDDSIFRHKAEKGWRGCIENYVHHAVEPDILFGR